MYDWHEIGVPFAVAKRQIAWDRRQTALRMRDAGMTLREIGNRCGGVGPERARQMVWRARRRDKYGACPVTSWMEAGGEISDMVTILRRKYWGRGRWLIRSKQAV
jgi:hypothetical protein